ncbi:MAG: phosphogluconate dehydrogenase (NAD(+)-dependent, decarboxylating) [Candidatus Taylorbacteria bacterium]
MKLGYIGLGKMGYNMVLRLHEKGHEVLAYNRSAEPREKIEKEIGIKTTDSLSSFKNLPSPRLIWLMVPEVAEDEIVKELTLILEKGDTIIDGGNSFYKNTIRRGEMLDTYGIHFLDAGVSGGPRGAREGACIMIGGDKEKFKELQSLFADLSLPKAYRFFGSHGAGHFTKMVHNGIEYGMMQAIAEGFAVLKKSDFNLNLKEVADLYNNGSVIESRLVGWLASGYKKYGEDLQDVSSEVAHTGEGKWTVETAKELNIPTPIIEGAYAFRLKSKEKPSYIGKVLSTLRNQFGGHSLK